MKKLAIVLIISLGVNFHLSSQVLNVSEIQQEQNQWCWAAVSSCILDYYCIPTAQCIIAEYTRNKATWHDFGDKDCCLSPNSGCNYWNYPWGKAGSIEDILKHFGNISNYGVGSLLSKSIITSDIQENKVFIIRWGWDEGGGHFVVGHGLVEDFLYYMDPWYGEGMKVARYSWVCSGGGHTWTHTNRLSVSLFPSEPIQPEEISGNDIACENSIVKYSIHTVPGANSYTWSLPGSWSGSSTSNSIFCTIGSDSGTISVTANNSCGSSLPRTKSISVILVPPTPIILLNGNILHSDATTGNQWYSYNGLISGETNQDLIVTENGKYYVIVTDSLCNSNPSNIINVVLTGTDITKHNNSGIIIYLNPFYHELSIEIENNYNTVNYEIINAIGQIIFKGNLVNRTIIQTSRFPSGIYLIKLKNEKTVEFKKIIIN